VLEIPNAASCKPLAATKITTQNISTIDQNKHIHLGFIECSYTFELYLILSQEKFQFINCLKTFPLTERILV
jgi:hypothetical protein